MSVGYQTMCQQMNFTELVIIGWLPTHRPDISFGPVRCIAPRTKDVIPTQVVSYYIFTVRDDPRNIFQLLAMNRD